MYSGSTLTILSGRLLGAHQKIDRLARRQLEILFPHCGFPGVQSILHFEGGNGPDAIKRKSPAQNEPWHYLKPFDANDTQLLELIEHHYEALVQALTDKDSVRASFEAAWLAHAVVDGLTPAHHYPYEERLVEISGGQDIAERTSMRKKILMPGASRSEQLRNNWKMWGPKGLLTTHAIFEWGVAMVLAPLKMRQHVPSRDSLQALQTSGVKKWFRRAAQDVARLELYDAFYQTGWTIPLARRIRSQLAPALVQAVTVIWYSAAHDAGLLKALDT